MSNVIQSDGIAGEPRIVVRNLTKTYRTNGGRVLALDDVSLEVGQGEILVLLGPSGCGKTTLLRCVAGLERPDSGEILVDGRVVFSSEKKILVPPEERQLGMVFQSYALWPHMTVEANVVYPLRNYGIKKDEARERARTVLNVVGLGEYAATFPGQLSGGQQQRVALARAIVANKGVVLFDEPLSNLDAKVRERLRLELLALQEKIRFSALYVTHDQAEATALANRITVMNVGTVAQVGTPLDIYNRPASRYVGQFIGNANEIPGTIQKRVGDHYCVATTAGPLVGVSGAEPLQDGSEVVVLLRPEHPRVELTNSSHQTNGVNRLHCTVERSIFMGPYVDYVVKIEATEFVLRSSEVQILEPGSTIDLTIDPDLLRIYPKD